MRNVEQKLLSRSALALGLAALALTGCSGGSGGSKYANAAERQFERYHLYGRHLDDVWIEETELPKTGSAEYAGTGGIRYAPSSQKMFAGSADLHILARFDDNGGTLTGEMTNFQGAPTTEQELRDALRGQLTDEELEDFYARFTPIDGSITLLSNFTPDEGASFFPTSINGRLDHDGKVVQFGGQAEYTAFSGQDGKFIALNGRTDSGMTITVDGVTRPGKLRGYVQRQ
ncbi:MAG: hypothetical protein CR993_06100 [Rhodobacterales bacterium]|nr:MAG: hypothetical protein CR993_06100 [Rhodobacterales bacterium]